MSGIPDPVFVCGRRGIFKLTNPAFAALAGRCGEDLTESSAALLEPPELAAVVLEQNEDILMDGEPRKFEFVLPSPRGVRFFSVTKGLCQGGKRPGDAVFGIVRELTHARDEEREIIDTSDHEKERLGHELRENFCQHLVGISLLGNVLYEELARAGLEQARFAKQITRLVKEVVSEVRTLEKSLSVAHLEQGAGLVEALRDLAELVGLQHKVSCAVQAPAVRLEVPAQTAMYLFRIVQEAVQSAARRVGVRRLLIRIAALPDGVALCVRDDGEAFPEHVNLEEWARGEFPVMHHRSRVIGAEVVFRRLDPGGIELICKAPCYRRRRELPGPKKRRKLK
ncbi:MAG: PAS domain-containing protein [Chthoniobacteraceae bacterium]